MDREMVVFVQDANPGPATQRHIHVSDVGNQKSRHFKSRLKGNCLHFCFQPRVVRMPGSSTTETLIAVKRSRTDESDEEGGGFLSDHQWDEFDDDDPDAFRVNDALPPPRKQIMTTKELHSMYPNYKRMRLWHDCWGT